MRRFLTYIIAASILMLSSMATKDAAAKKIRVPKRTPVQAHVDKMDGTVFSTPDTSQNPPIILGKKDWHLAGFDHARLLNDLSGDQRKRIESLQRATNLAVQALQEHINVLNPKLDAAEIAEWRTSIEVKRNQSIDELGKILTEDQRDKINRMRHGELFPQKPPEKPPEPKESQ